MQVMWKGIYYSNIVKYLEEFTQVGSHVCKPCRKRFASKFSLYIHRSHTGEKLFIYKQCGESIQWTQILSTTWNNYTGEKLHVCKPIENLLKISYIVETCQIIWKIVYHHFINFFENKLSGRDILGSYPSLFQ